ncbi:hypothetical protein BDP27DRAFT_1421894 [Rhodocollybia butyracea]|uniref:protein-tyrosine-phosphatase n=1 Tax=Rhodocollybia butyracea TaxID=206335 RepID=A0A9P5PV38_9AGAR|nr:hypothetical protein BDP27DRAFT_1421894 [Rhodocollybia butyracea]
MDDDFFGSKPDPPTISDDVDTFAKAVSKRSVLNPVLNPKALDPTKRPISSNISLKPSSDFAFVEPEGLALLINNPAALVLDIRPHAAHSSARIPSALSLSVPSTLLKRPLFSLDRLAAMLPSASARARLTEWPKFSTIVVYDVDSTGSPFLPDGNNILGLLRKFANDPAYSGNTLLWLKGGFQRVWRERRDLVDLRPPDPEVDDDINDTDSLKTTQLPSSAFGSGTTTKNPQDKSSPHKRPPSTLSLRANAPNMSDKPVITPSVPFNPFFDTIRQNIELSQGITERIPLRLPKRVRRRIDDLPFEWLREISRRADTKLVDSSTTEDSHSSSSSEDESHSFRPPKSTHKALPPGPVYDHLIAEAPIAGHSSNNSSTPKQHSTPSPPSQAMLDKGMEALAMQFYSIELAEQQRLMGVMHHHSAESGVVNLKQGSLDSPMTTLFPLADVSARGPDSPHSAQIANSSGASSVSEPYRSHKPSNLGGISSNISESDGERGKSQKTGDKPAPFPYSITAGVEKGSKNRYRHIWPFEHARVRLHQRRHSPSRKYPQPHPRYHSPIPFKRAPSSTTSSRPPSGALTGLISSTSSHTGGAPISRSVSDANKPHRMKGRQGAKPNFGVGGLNLGGPFTSSALTAPLTGLNASTIGGSALKPSFTSMRVPAPPAGSGGETTESEYDSEWEASGRENVYDDYVNASYVQPICTSRRYIATQGPLEATFVDFWTLVYQQNVHVIVMLTREIEGAMVKCGPYWKDEVFGPLRLKLISVEGNVDEGKDDDVRRKVEFGDPGSDGFFSFPVALEPNNRSAKGKMNSVDAIIKRTFLLSHTSYPEIPPRKVTQFQYLEWPDMNVPDDPRGVLGLIRQVDQAVTETMHLNEYGEEDKDSTAKDINANDIVSGVPAIIQSSPLSRSRKGSEESLNRYTGIANHALGRKHSPVLLHCSAGVGRTGGFIAVDAVLDGIRRELRKQKRFQKVAHTIPPHATDDSMDVDEDRAEEDGQGNWNKFKPTRDIDMVVDNGTDFNTIAIPANSSGDVLHVPVHQLAMVRPLHFFHRSEQAMESDDDLPTPSASFYSLYSQNVNSYAQPAINSSSDRPMQIDDYFATGFTKERDLEPAKPVYQRQASSTRMWAEDVSDQTGSHGTAVRVDEARRQMLSENRLSERDVSLLEPKFSTLSKENTVSEDSESMDMDRVKSPDRLHLPPGQDVVARQKPTVEVGSGAPSIVPLSSIDSASSSDDSYRFQSNFKGARYHRFGHQTSHSLPYGESNLTSSTGTSFSSLQSLPGSAMPKTSAPQINTSNGTLLPAINLRGEDARLRTWSAPSARPPQTAVSKVEGIQDADETSQVVPKHVSSWLTGEGERVVEKSPSPFSGSRNEDSGSVPPPSRSLSPFVGSTTNSSHQSSSVVESVSSSNPASHPPTLDTSNGSETLKKLALPASIQKSTSLPTTGSQPGKDTPADSPQPPPLNSRFSYPRVLHSDKSPDALSKFEEPLMEVLQDMRKQRMSLCQSLRQYVFVHAAVIEGALMIVDEERKRERKEMKMDVDDVVSKPFQPDSGLLHSPVRPTRRTTVSLSSTPSTGKRVASPTELPKEDEKGEQVLFKKPSIKRKVGNTPNREPWSFRNVQSAPTLQPPPP